MVADRSFSVRLDSKDRRQPRQKPQCVPGEDLLLLLIAEKIHLLQAARHGGTGEQSLQLLLQGETCHIEVYVVHITLEIQGQLRV